MAQLAARGKDPVPLGNSASWCELALVTFIVLMLTGVIDWSWWWVLSSLWIGGILTMLGVCALHAGQEVKRAIFLAIRDSDTLAAAQRWEALREEADAVRAETGLGIEVEHIDMLPKPSASKA